MKNITRILIGAALLALAVSCSQRPSDGAHTLYVLTTNDVHGQYFDSTYVGNTSRNSLMAVNYYVDSVRNAVGRENVLLLDAGDCLQGDNAAYYYNYVATEEAHLYPRLVKYMGYDAITVGNHDVETAHPVYDRVRAQLESYGIPFLAGNALTPEGKPYFQEYKVFKRAGLKVLVLGYTNANIRAWLAETIWSGMDFVSLVPFVQERVDAVVAKEKPDVVIVSVHSGTGEGDGSMLESQALDLYKSLSGVDCVICSHDHRAFTAQSDSICLINSGSHARNVGFGQLTFDVKDGKVASKKHCAGCIPVDKTKADAKMREAFAADYEAVRKFTVREVGELCFEMRTRDSYAGQNPYMDFIHTVQLQSTGAQVSFAAPLSFNKEIHAGKLIFNDMFSLYPYENTLSVVELTGEEIRNYIENSYAHWIQTYDGKHVFNMSPRDDPRYFQSRWSFNFASYNFDSAAGLNYTVDITKPVGKRVVITSLKDGSAFDPETKYTVAMTSYRAAGGGNLIFDGTGLSREELEARTVGQYPEIRDLIYEYIVEKGTITEDLVSNVGSWRFVPERLAEKAVSNDMKLLFGNL